MGRDGEPFLIAANTARRAAFLAKTYIPNAEEIQTEKIEIRKGSTNPKPI